MSVQGLIQTMVVPDFLQWVQVGKKTGVALFQKQNLIKELVFENGTLIWANSNDPREHLGQIALQKGLITPARLKEIMNLQKTSAVAVGQILLEMQILNGEQLRQLLLEKFTNCFYELFLWDAGKFCFRPEEVESYKNDFSCKLEVHYLILEGARRLDEWVELKRLFNSQEITIALSKKFPEKLETPFEAKLLHQIRAEKKLGQIILEMRLQDYLVLATLKEWKKKNWIEVHKPKDQPIITKERLAELSNEPPATLEEVLRLTRHKDYVMALQRLNTLEDPMQGREIAELRQELEAHLIEASYKNVSRTSILDLQANATETASSKALNAHSQFVLSLIDGKTETETVVMSSPLGAFQTFSEIKALLDDNLIRVRKG